jgi:hypothetical protein
MKRLWTSTLALVVLGSLMPLAGAAAIPMSKTVPVLDGPRFELDFSAVDRYRSWIKANDALNYRLIVHPRGVDRYVVAKGDEVGVGSDLALGTTLGDVLVFTGSGGDSDLRVWDLDAKRIIHTPEGVNTSDPEYGAEISGDHLLFGRDPKHNGTASQVVLMDITRGRFKILARSKHGVTPDSINGDWASYTVCGTTCDVFRYRISTGRARKIPHADRYPLYASTVTSEGAVFLVRGVGGCGGGVSIVRWTPSGRRNLEELPDRFDVWNTDSLVTGDTTSVFLERVTCSSHLDYDIYRLDI